MSYIKEEFRVANWVNLLMGLWLIAVPFALGFSHEAARWNSIIAGVCLSLVALVGVVQPLRHPAFLWVTFGFGLWLLIAPFLLEYSHLLGATLTHICFGVILLALAAGSIVGVRMGDR